MMEPEMADGSIPDVGYFDDISGLLRVIKGTIVGMFSIVLMDPKWMP